MNGFVLAAAADVVVTSSAVQSDNPEVVEARRRKIPVTVLLRALGYVKDSEILSLFYDVETHKLTKTASAKDDELIGLILADDIVNKGTGEIIAEANSDFTVDMLTEAREAEVSEVRFLKKPKGVLDTDIIPCLTVASPNVSNDKAFL